MVNHDFQETVKDAVKTYLIERGDSRQRAFGRCVWRDILFLKKIC
jgi:hypothetical protein